MVVRDKERVAAESGASLQRNFVLSAQPKLFFVPSARPGLCAIGGRLWAPQI